MLAIGCLCLAAEVECGVVVKAIAKAESTMSADGRLTDVTGDDGQVRSKRREFFAQAAAIVFAASGPIFCGCKGKTSSGVDGDSTRDQSQQPPQDQGSSSYLGPADSVEQRLIEIVAEQMGIPRDKVQRKSRFKEDLGADSLDTVELVMELEEEFAINIPDDVAMKTRTVEQAIDVVTRLLGNRPLPPRKIRPKAPPSGRGGSPKDLNRRKPAAPP